MRWLLLILLVSLPALGQTNDRRRYTSSVFNRGEQVRRQLEASLWRFGRLHLTPILGIKEFGYDSNVFSQEDNVATSDFTLSPELGMQSYLRLDSRWIWANKATANYLYYQDEDQLNGWEYGIESHLYGLFKRAFVDFSVRWNEDRQRITSEVDNRVISDRLEVSADIILQPLPRGFLTLSPDFYRIRYDDNAESAVLRSLERDETGMTVNYLHKVRSQFRPFVDQTAREERG